MKIEVAVYWRGAETKATIQPSWNDDFDGHRIDIMVGNERITVNAAELTHAAQACLRVQQEEAKRR